jgi:hypothetical protein
LSARILGHQVGVILLERAIGNPRSSAAAAITLSAVGYESHPSLPTVGNVSADQLRKT